MTTRCSGASLPFWLKKSFLSSSNVRLETFPFEKKVSDIERVEIHGDRARGWQNRTCSSCRFFHFQCQIRILQVVHDREERKLRHFLSSPAQNLIWSLFTHFSESLSSSFNVNLAKASSKFVFYVMCVYTLLQWQGAFLRFSENLLFSRWIQVPSEDCERDYQTLRESLFMNL